ncbi:exodeoxyribonuclease VII small subunit [Myxacorys almedinensis]|uniref:Exodeoxyribonuclease 7 small subunit n=1 Tax=Myxacorys almedinensis A TaxID=2690445 RepID=A0A8J7YXS6_9CYAN|nr:exodeoxyribonuclease VII small subunit [Myxacorys almedinensis]NDJ16582.1 exodeoxyribonuclease VII small subunit [Myxacorys almedinensis A]
MANSPSSKTASAKVTRLSSTVDEDNWNYEETVAKVEEILTRIEAGELELAAVFEEFSAAVEYLRQCESFLAERQKQVDLLIETLTDESEF